MCDKALTYNTHVGHEHPHTQSPQTYGNLIINSYEVLNKHKLVNEQAPISLNLGNC